MCQNWDQSACSTIRFIHSQFLSTQGKFVPFLMRGLILAILEANSRGNVWRWCYQGWDMEECTRAYCVIFSAIRFCHLRFNWATRKYCLVKTKHHDYTLLQSQWCIFHQSVHFLITAITLIFYPKNLTIVSNLATVLLLWKKYIALDILASSTYYLDAKRGQH